MYKSVASVILSCLQPAIEPLGHEGQYGFTQEFSCADIAFCEDNDEEETRARSTDFDVVLNIVKTFD